MGNFYETNPSPQENDVKYFEKLYDIKNAPTRVFNSSVFTENTVDFTKK